MPQFIKDRTILNIEQVLKDLGEADVYEDEENGGQFLQTIYLGSILSLTPSGKVYYPFACSNVDKCPRCRGEGTIKNKHKSSKKEDAITRKIDRIANKWTNPYYSLTRNQKRLIDKLRKIREHYQSYNTCPECNGLGSLEARLDEDWWNRLQKELDTIDAWCHGSESDGCDVLISRACGAAVKEDTCHR